MRKGGQNKTHGMVESAPRIDSFEVADRPHGSVWIEPSRYSLHFDRIYNSDGEFAELRYLDSGWTVEVPLEVVHGVRPQTFWLCPDCGKRVRYLYFHENHFACRKCAKLNYQTQQTFRDSLWFFREGIKYAEAHLSWMKPSWVAPVDFPDIMPDKPRYMHWKTYKRHIQKVRWYQGMYRKLFIEEAARLLGRPEWVGRSPAARKGMENGQIIGNEESDRDAEAVRR